MEEILTSDQTSLENIRTNIESIRARMESAAVQAGRDPKSIVLCAASKMNDAERVRFAVENGVDCCGENRVQELQEKLPKGAYTGRPVHFIGHLQTNKVNKVVGYVDLIQSVDSGKLLLEIQKEAHKRGIIQNILLEVNIGGEESKSGMTPDEAERLASEMGNYPDVHLCGLMAIPPVSEEPGANRKYFAQMSKLFVDISAKKYDNVNMVCLSMGMSDDFEDAIAEGSTMVRVGSAIFGRRNYQK